MKARRHNPRGRHALACLLLGLAVIGSNGCTSLAKRIAQPESVEGGLSLADWDKLEQHLGITRHRLRTPDDVDIAWRLVPAAERGFDYRYTPTPDGAKLELQTDQKPQPLPARGTVVFLHGWNMDASTMLLWALSLSERGYQGIAIDLRNHGASGRAPAGFGSREAGDVVAVLDHLQARDALPQPVHLFGVSYGAVTALFAEATLRERIAGIVAMEPYGNAADGIRGMVAAMLDSSSGGLRGWLTRGVVGWRYGEAADIDRAIDEAGELLALDLDRIDVRDALADSDTCTLLLHGADDRFIPVAVARELAEAGPQMRYTEIPDHGHIDLPMRVDWLAAPIADWMQATANGNCPELHLPKDPAGSDSQDAVQ